MKLSFERKPHVQNITKFSKIAALSLVLGIGNPKEATAQNIQELKISDDIVLKAGQGELAFFEIFVDEAKKDLSDLAVLSSEYSGILSQLEEKSAVYSAKQAMMEDYIENAAEYLSSKHTKFQKYQFSIDNIEDEMDEFYSIAKKVNQDHHMLPVDLAKKFINFVQATGEVEDLEKAYALVSKIEEEDAKTKEGLASKVRVKLVRSRDDSGVSKETIENLISPTSYVSRNEFEKVLAMYFEILMLEDKLEQNEISQDELESRIEFFIQSFHDAGIEVTHTKNTDLAHTTP